MKRTIPIWILFLLTMACHQGGEGNSGKQNKDSLSYETINLYQSLNNCEKDSENCTYIEFTYPQFTNVNGVLADSLLDLNLKTFCTQDKKIMAPDSIQQLFLSEYTDFIKIQKGYSTPWYIQREMSVVNQNPKWITLRIEEENFTGGNHPNSTTTYKMLDTKTGRQLHLSDFFDTVSIVKLTALGEPLFCAERGIKPSVGFEEAGFWFPENHFHLNTNFFIGEEGITFYYNTYEVGPYVLGPTRITIPANNIIKLLKQELH